MSGDIDIEEYPVIKTIDEDGNEVSLKLVDIVTVDDSEYALLARENQVVEDDSEVVLMRLIKEGEEYIFETIDNDEEFELVSQAILEEDVDEEEEDED
ncbi:hypothetical protein tpqmel_0378 [Candidatus Gastranaerophilus sp. (ex Termes propinquus)]|nr:hypothetical protein tpqmel_0378 [Candidatus Gastranaerophilus sp. (ex Termes propinquus)]